MTGGIIVAMRLPVDIVLLVGPTAVGKTAVGISLARRIDGEIVSADSMQVYRGLDILSGAPTQAEQRGVRHHMIGVVGPHACFDVARYVCWAQEKVKDIRGRGKNPLIVGGSGMYVRAVLDGLFDGPPRDTEIRRRLEQAALSEGTAALYDRLLSVDPQSAQRIHPHDLKRIVRALEVYEITGRRLSSLQREWKNADKAGEGKGAFPFSKTLGGTWCMIGLIRERGELKKRVNARVEHMFGTGAVDEVKRLMDERIPHAATIRQALGVAEITGYLEGERSLAETKELLKKNTRAFVKRQLTWFKKDKRITWLEIGPSEPPEEVAGRIEKIICV
jgi:tRNA dimethylallyltransferase